MSFPSIDRALTKYLFYPVSRKFRYSRATGIPILMYHSISSNDCSKHVNNYYQTNTLPDIFSQHMGYLKENSYDVINLIDIEKFLTLKNDEKGKLAVITFDDGYRDFITTAFPILTKYRFSATVFLPTGYIDDERAAFKERECLNWDEVRELSSMGVKFGSHTISHSQLRSLNKKDIEYEIRRSREVIEDEICDTVNSFSYPYAFPEADRKFKMYLKNVLIDTGYKIGVSTRIGTTTSNEEIFFLRRIPINSYDDLSFFKAKLEGGYDWFQYAQYIRKFTKTKISK